jgi:hypothetical protein
MLCSRFCSQPGFSRSIACTVSETGVCLSGPFPLCALSHPSSWATGSSRRSRSRKDGCFLSKDGSCALRDNSEADCRASERATDSRSHPKARPLISGTSKAQSRQSPSFPVGQLTGSYPETGIWKVLAADHAAEKSGTRRIRRLCTRLAVTSFSHSLTGLARVQQIGTAGTAILRPHLFVSLV